MELADPHEPVPPELAVRLHQLDREIPAAEVELEGASRVDVLRELRAERAALAAQVSEWGAAKRPTDATRPATAKRPAAAAAKRPASSVNSAASRRVKRTAFTLRKTG